ncbi:MAG: pyridoxine 5-phosphate synthase [Candidatus Tokpelaia sp. JSC161]|jgi:pyridoxine 5-phosphate synthase|nr:MAG: pyridoxine 5-phosphate synthase [Candidatus Tokpelaia sp. JSC161]
MSVMLSVNLNAIAFLRNRRNASRPELIHLGRLALNAGAAGITVHPRPDQRHIRFSDLADIRELLDDSFPACELNIEGYPTENFLDLVEKNRADQVTLVPDSPAQSTSDHGWDFENNAEFLDSVMSLLKKNKTRVSLFSNPDSCGLEIAHDLGADRVEFYTGLYGAANDEQKRSVELEKLVRAAEVAHSLGVLVNAGHDLTVANLPLLLKRIPYLSEVSVGHGFVADALEYGIQRSVERFLHVLR